MQIPGFQTGGLPKQALSGTMKEVITWSVARIINGEENARKLPGGGAGVEALARARRKTLLLKTDPKLKYWSRKQPTRFHIACLGFWVEV